MAQILSPEPLHIQQRRIFTLNQHQHPTMSGNSPPYQRRSRSGCWTCRTRKKRCDSISFPCKNCFRLGLFCESGTKLVWEDDVRREGMRRRGPKKYQLEKDKLESSTTLPTRIWQFDPGEALLLDNYIQCFSRTYSTCSDPSNPFLSILLPISMQAALALRYHRQRVDYSPRYGKRIYPTSPTSTGKAV
jgi:hypothetical protein